MGRVLSGYMEAKKGAIAVLAQAGPDSSNLAGMKLRYGYPPPTLTMGSECVTESVVSALIGLQMLPTRRSLHRRSPRARMWTSDALSEAQLRSVLRRHPRKRRRWGHQGVQRSGLAPQLERWVGVKPPPLRSLRSCVKGGAEGDFAGEAKTQAAPRGGARWIERRLELDEGGDAPSVIGKA